MLYGVLDSSLHFSKEAHTSRVRDKEIYSVKNEDMGILYHGKERYLKKHHGLSTRSSETPRKWKYYFLNCEEPRDILRNCTKPPKVVEVAQNITIKICFRPHCDPEFGMQGVCVCVLVSEFTLYLR